MEVKEEKRPMGGIDKYLHFIVLILSSINLLQLVPRLFNWVKLNEVGSILLSLVGLISFWLIYKNRKGGEILIFVWAFLQLILFVNYPKYSFDLSQAFSLPIEFSFYSSSYGFTIRDISISINIVATVLTSAAFFRLRNKNDYRELVFTPNNIENLAPFTANILKSYSFGDDKKILILSHTSASKSYAIQVGKKDKLSFKNPQMEYLLCEINTEKTLEKSFKPYEFKQLGNVNIKILDKD